MKSSYSYSNLYLSVYLNLYTLIKYIILMPNKFKCAYPYTPYVPCGGVWRYR